MTPEQWQEVRRIYEAVIDGAPEQRAAVLTEACADDAELRAQVERLLSASSRAGAFLETAPALDPASLAAAVGRRLGPYQIVRELGQGGMSTVFLAVRADDAYQQEVAIKLVGPGLRHAEVIQRFKQERQILASLDHPNIARLLDGGTTEEGWPYLVMEYIAGLPITEYCRQQQLSLTARLQLFRTVCAAVAYAHRNLIIHRDLKPSNILVTADGTVKLLDFGIAKILSPPERGEQVALTQSRLSWLTPAYASPEQLRNEAITTASDVYSLGVLLYELLTGARPHDVENLLPHDAARVLCEAEAEKPSLRVTQAVDAPQVFGESSAERLQRRLRGDLDNIVLKALAKEAEQRYPAVEQLSADLARHLAGKPVIARPPTLGYRAGKLIRRRKAAAGALLLALLAALGVLLWQAVTGPERARQQRRLFYAATIRRAEAAWETGRRDNYQAALDACLPQPGAEDLRGFEWHYLGRLNQREAFSLRHAAAIESADFVSGGARILASSADKTWKLWEAETGRELFALKNEGSFNMALSPDGQREFNWLAYGGDGQPVKIHEIETGRLLYTINDPTAPIRYVGALSDKQILATGYDDGTVKFWDLETLRPRFALRDLVGPVLKLWLSADGNRMLTRIGDDHVQLWDVPRRRVLATYAEAVGSSMRFAPGGKWFWTVAASRKLTLRESATGRTLGAVEETHDSIVSAYTLDARRIYTGSHQGVVKIYEMPSLRLLASFKAHPSAVVSACLSSDGKTLATSGDAGEVKLWDSAMLRELSQTQRRTGGFQRLAFSPDGRKLLAGNNDGVVQVWDVAALLGAQSVLQGHQGKVFSVAFAPDGHQLATASQDRTIKLWDAQTGALLKTLTGHTGQVFCVVFSPDGKRLASSGDDYTARIWDVATGRVLFKLDHPSQIHSVAFAPNGKWLATGCDDKLVRLWDAATGREIRRFAGHTAEVWTVVFAPDSRTLVSGGCDKTLKLWDVATGHATATLAAHSDCVWSAVFSRDGKWLATGSTDRTAILWEWATRQPLRTFTGHEDEVFEVAFSPDGQRLATASNDHKVKVWDVATGQPLLTLRDHTDEVWSVAFSPDGQTLASGSWDGTVRLWRAATEAEVQSSRKP